MRFLRRLILLGCESDSVCKKRIMVSTFARTTENRDGIVWLQLDEGLLFRANHIGARIWRGLLEQKDPGVIAGEISREYGVAREEVESDVAAFLADLAARRLIRMDGKAA